MDGCGGLHDNGTHGLLLDLSGWTQVSAWEGLGGVTSSESVLSLGEAGGSFGVPCQAQSLNLLPVDQDAKLSATALVPVEPACSPPPTPCRESHGL